MKNQLTLFDDYPDSGNLNENKENKPDENQRIEDLILGKVARRILSTNGIETTDQLISRPVTDYEAMAGNARKAYQEIMRLYQSVTEGKPLTFSETSVKHRKEDQALYEGLPDSLADVSTGVLLLGKRARKQLTDHGINTMGEACSLTVQQMMQNDTDRSSFYRLRAASYPLRPERKILLLCRLIQFPVSGLSVYWPTVQSG